MKVPILDNRRKAISAVICTYPGGRNCSAERRARSTEYRMDSAWFGQGAQIKQRALDTALRMVAYPPKSPEARREPAITYELELGTPTPSFSEYPAANDRVEDEAFELMTYTQGPDTPVVETKINQEQPELPEDPESKNHTTPKPE